MPQLENETKILMLLSVPLFILDILLYILSFAWLPKLLSGGKMYSVAHGEPTKTHSAPRRSTNHGHEQPLIESVYDGGKAKTVYAMTQIAITEFSTRTAMQWRKFVEMRKLKETDRFPSKVFDDSVGFQKLSYKQLGQQIDNFGAGLRELGLEPIPETDQKFDDVKGNFCMVIFEDTCSQWTIALQGAFSQSITVATCYATLGEDAVVSAVNETGATALFLNFKNATKFSKLASKMPTLKTIIASTHEMPEGTPTPAPEKGSKVKIVSSDDVLKMGEKNSVSPVPPKVCVQLS